MKRLIVFLLSLTLISGAFVSCSGKTADVAQMLSSLLEEIPESASDAALYSKNGSHATEKMAPDDFGRLYTGKWQSPACFTVITDFAIRLPVDDSGFEIHIASAANVSDTEDISALFSRRIEKLKNAEIKAYAPDSFLKYYENAEVFVKGRYVFLLATPDNAAVKKKIGRLL